ncbi:hypothetical protein HBI60_032400 [Parastagonospora nodorum]|nr:hypothetical protein HBI71_004570 [Parastagonospora nodorum]KAH5424727.1 hypothetical protein HBI47_125930 [Parastagonospora nodorum]KAH5767755.1 hypothetical protein HBI16_136460 [Parastagonospora nodorum]KAH6405775.1 hypothetical protein HBI60_032400 [Parastagonospora nodorum]
MKLSLVISALVASALAAPLIKTRSRDIDDVVGNLWHAKDDQKRSDSDEVIGNLWHAKDDSN